MTIKFLIAGNQDDRAGNPIPKNRKTIYQRWMPDAKRYVAWKDKIVGDFLEVVIHDRELRRRGFASAYVNKGKPIELGAGEKARMDLKIYWKNGTHGDPENIFGAIADALFVNDKNLDGGFESRIAEDGKGKVEVEIAIQQERI